MFRIDRNLTADDLDKALRRDVAEGLSSNPKQLPPKWFYDERGSALFEDITELPEYYPTRAERAILEERSDEIAGAAGAEALIELGSGSGVKTRLLLDAMGRHGALARFVPVDVSGDFLAASARRVADDYPDLDVHAVVGDFEHHLGLLPVREDGGRQTIAVLGSTIGNQEPGPRAGFLRDIRAVLRPGDTFLLGADLVKDADRLVAAYDDAQGVTAEFDRNVLNVINRELGADFDPSEFEHVARWNEKEEWIEMRLRSRVDQHVRVAALDLDVDFAAGEEMRTEISAKFRREGLEEELEEAGFEPTHWWTDPAGDFALSLSTARA
ncbi:L-histidine N(alpha)-methyltransferase [Nocardiopsis changdeensis]|uniref:Histidine N-alpha-methyltransferase n=1 Tax=Nocardiopsis changdeensis TaxID=2831969 RepID=A0ABX8BH87_9ACTN|nr:MULTISPECIES: L-histidine N(alpha)-methyltransferase [Nocardiopsis]QUX21476.1 L-histidine N(alpha)-methyltransferase [Nocardiopsis changdeensis]QYX37410.1 L-histidine N(alpha)-methyltransferase [Nocardiopsis sp. MT53]